MRDLPSLQCLARMGGHAGDDRRKRVCMGRGGLADLNP